MKENKRNWLVRIRCTVIKIVAVKNCTKVQARLNPWEFAQDADEIEQHEWKVESVESDN